MIAKIYKPARSAMQSGYAKSRDWVLEYTPEKGKPVDPLMGWIGATETVSQLRLTFETRDEAVAYAERHGIAYQLAEPKRRGHVIRPGGYGDNFSPARRIGWTH
ncbi:ETC complex I subunit [soil metagenome]